MKKHQNETERMRSQMLSAMQRCANAQGWKLTTVSRYAMNNANWYGAIANGAGFTTTSYDKVMRFCAEHGAEGA